MIRMSVLYPTDENDQFNHDYYSSKHVPLALSTWGLPESAAQIDKGVNGPYVAAVHFTFDSMEAMGAAMGAPGTAEVMADIPNYTTVTPVMQISEIV